VRNDPGTTVGGRERSHAFGGSCRQVERNGVTSIYSQAIRCPSAIADPDPETVAVLVQAPQWTPSPTTLTFANQAVGTQSSTQTVTFTNTGAAPLRLDSIGSSDTTNFPETNTCGRLPATYQPGTGCSVTVTFAPSVPGNLSADISVMDNITDPGPPPSPQLVPLTGTGTQSFMVADSGNRIDAIVTSFSMVTSPFGVAGSMKETMPAIKATSIRESD